MGAKFLFCLPLRLGVSIFTMGQFLAAGAFAALVWFVTFAKETNLEWFTFSRMAKTPLIVLGSVYSFVALVGLLGFFGAMFKKTGLISTYLVVLWISFFVQIGSSIWGVVTFFRLRDLGKNDQCESQLQDLKVDDPDLQKALELICDGLEQLQNIHPAVVISVVVAITLVTGYVIYIGHCFLGRLKDKKFEKQHGGLSRSGPAYAPVKEEHHPLTVPQAQYPYSDASNSFGHTKAPSTGYAPVGAGRA